LLNAKPGGRLQLPISKIRRNGQAINKTHVRRMLEGGVGGSQQNTCWENAGRRCGRLATRHMLGECWKEKYFEDSNKMFVD
jgi:hypothetical protein